MDHDQEHAACGETTSLVQLKNEDGTSSVKLERIETTGSLSPLEGRRKHREDQRVTKYSVVDTSSLDFERVVNLYTIQATRDRVSFAQSTIQSSERKCEIHDNHQNDSPIRYNTFEQTSNTLPPPPPPAPAATLSPSCATDQTWEFLNLWKPKPRTLGYTGRTSTRWLFTIVTGLMTGVMSITIVGCTDAIQKWRFETVDSLWRNNSRSFVIFALYTMINLAMALLSACLCLYFAPQAIGSGIPEVKAYLNGVRVLRFTNVSLFLVKIVGTVLSVSSGLAIGPEGPLVHTGAVIGASCTKLSATLFRILPLSCVTDHRVCSVIMTDLSHFAHDGERRDFVSIGAAAGFAAAFGAPIGGLLFALEEASSYFDQTMFLKTLVATSLATFCLAVHHGNLSEYSVISLGEFHTSNAHIFVNRIEELPMYIVVAVIGGLMGGLFVNCWKMLKNMKRKLFSNPKFRNIWALCEVALVSLLTSTLVYGIPLMDWTCRGVGSEDDFAQEEIAWKFHPLQFDCPNGNINELASIFFGSREDAIRTILSHPAQYQPRTLICVGLVFFMLMTITAGVSLPSGIFMPTFLIGTSLGGAAGIYFQKFIAEEISPSTFALLGAAALLAGIQRSTVSLCVILVEGTGQVKVLMPVIVTVVVARYVGDRVSKHGLYETAMEVAKYPYLEHEEKNIYDLLQVRDVMSSPPVTVGPREKAYNIQRLLNESAHHGFPVVEAFTKKFLGLIRRDQLVALLECGVFEDNQDQVQDHQDDDHSSAGGSAHGASETWTPRPGVGKSPLMHLAYHITDDRYDHVDDRNIGEDEKTLGTIVEDAFDKNDWLLSLQRRRVSFMAGRSSKGETNGPAHFDESIGFLSAGREEDSSEPTAIVGTNEKGNVIIKWLNPNSRNRWVNIGAVMNKGTYCVTEFCPLSKAYLLYTSLGLRHLIVLGGEGGGQVVGVMTRINMLKDFIQERTGYQL